MSTRKLPKTDSIQELATFWDTRDLTEFQYELEELTEPVFVRETTIKVHLQSSEAEAVQQIAQSKGVSPEEVVQNGCWKNSHAGKVAGEQSVES